MNIKEIKNKLIMLEYKSNKLMWGLDDALRIIKGLQKYGVDSGDIKEQIKNLKKYIKGIKKETKIEF